MERQKPRVGQSLDGLSRPLPRARYYLYNSESLRTNGPYVTMPADTPPKETKAIPVQEEPSLNQPTANKQPEAAINTISMNQTKDQQALLPRSIGGQDQSAPSLLGSNIPSQSYVRPQKSRKRKFKFNTKRTLKWAAIGVAVAVIGFGGWFGSSIIASIDKVFHGNVFSDAHALISGSSLKESGGRVNILLAGDSTDDPNHQGGVLTDSIMVVSINPQTKTGFILSIPRDLWVNIPSMGHQKINAANDVSNFSSPGLPSGGMGQLEQIVQTDLGIPIDYEALIDYTAFKDAVNTVGGITIDVQSPDPRGIYDAYTQLSLRNGWVTLTGQEALNLARARGDNIAGDVSYGLPNSDFDRTMHQRQMLEALFKKATSLGVLSNPIKISSLFSAFGNNVQTNLSLGDVISLLRLTNGLNTSNLQSDTYSYGSGNNYLLTSYHDPRTNQDALIPTLGMDNFSGVQEYYQQLISSNPIVQEAPTVTLLNASDVSGLASREREILVNQGFNVVSMADASKNFPGSLILDNTNGQKPSASSALAKDIKAQVVTSPSGSLEAEQGANYSTNYVVVMGQDWDGTKATGNPIQN